MLVTATSGGQQAPAGAQLRSLWMSQDAHRLLPLLLLLLLLIDHTVEVEFQLQ
jgi:hypothetical protein